MKIKTSALTGAALDWAVAKCLGIRVYIGRYEHTMTGPCLLDAELVDMNTDGPQELKFSRDWAQGGQIIDVIEGFQLKVWLESRPQTKCEAHIHNYDGDYVAFGPTPLIAAMRCFCCSKLGEEIDVPEELLK